MRFEVRWRHVKDGRNFAIIVSIWMWFVLLSELWNTKQGMV